MGAYSGCVRLGNLDLYFKIRISDLQSNAQSENGFQRWDTCFWIFIFEKLSLRTAVFPAHAYLAKRITLFTRIVLQILFRIPNRTVKRKSMKSGFGFFLIEIHPEDGFLGGQIRFQISRSIGKSGFRFWKSKSGFPNRTHPLFLKSACVSKGWCKFKFKLEILEEFCMNPPGSVEDLKKLHFTWDSEATFYGFWFTLRKR